MAILPHPCRGRLSGPHLLLRAGGFLAVTVLLTAAGLAWAQPAPGAAQSMPGMNMPAASTPAAGVSQWQLWAALAVVVLFVLFLLAHRAGALRGVSTGVAGGLALLMLAFFLTSYVVARYRQPGQTSLLEANLMDMSGMRAPPGTVPVATETLQPGLFAGGVTYTGTVVAFSDEDVYPRVTGTIQSLPVYAGDRVQAGQLLVRLDDQEYAAQAQAAAWAEQGQVRAQLTAEREQSAAAASQRQAVDEVARMQAEAQVARQQIASSEAAITESQSAVRQAQHEQEAAQSAQAAAEQARDAAQAQAETAAADVPAAEADVTGAQADADYWQAEIQREKKLLAQGAVSTNEYQREEDQAKAAQAKLAQTQAMVRQKRAAAQGAQAQVRQAEAQIRQTQAQAASAEAGVAQAQARVERATADRATAQAQLSAALAAVRSAQSGVGEKSAETQASAARVSEAAAGVGQSAAALTAATTVRGYTEIRATRPGRVIQRVVSPGVLVSPGTLILRVAQVDHVRLQAYVTEQDLQWLRVGDPVEARHPCLPGGVLHARVTSLFPAADPVTRLATVEAVVDNPGEVLAPGDAITLKITAPPQPDTLTVPNSAIVWQPAPSGGPTAAQQPAVWTVAAQTGSGHVIYTCPMHPQIQEDKPGSCPLCGMTLVPKSAAGVSGAQVAHLTPVTLGHSDGERTEVLSGLCAGQEIITAGQTDLHEGDAVSPVPWGPQGPMQLPPAPGATPAPPAGRSG